MRPRPRSLALVALATVVVVAVVGPWLSPDDPAVQHLAARLTGPSWAHPLGLDELGRDILARLLVGARVSFAVGLSVVGISTTVGVAIGAVAGYMGGWVDDLVGRVMDVLLAFPGMLLAIALVAMLGPSLTHVVLALTLIGWVSYARLVRGQVLAVREMDYVQAARALGAAPARIIVRHVVPATWPSLVVQGTLGMAGAMLAEASLSFLGLGVQPPTPSWGAMLDAGRSHLFDAPHVTIFPGLALAAAVIVFNLAGESLRRQIETQSISPSEPRAT
jgi:peptide/nickel transport system permease protein